MALTQDQASEISAITTQEILTEIPDELARSTYSYKFLVDNKKEVEGGKRIQAPIYAFDLASQGMIDGRYGTISTDQNQQITFAEFDWKVYYFTVAITLLDMIQTNNTKNAIMDLATAKKRGAVSSVVRFLSQQFHGTAATNPLNFNGLTDVFAASPTSYGNLSPTNVPTWLPFFDTTSTTPDYKTFSRIIDELRVRTQTAPSSGMVDVMISNQRVYSAYKQSLQIQQRFTDAEKLESGFKGIDVDGVFFYPDPDVRGDSGVSNNYVYFLNKMALYLGYKYWFDKDAPMTKSDIQIPNQPVQFSANYFAGNLLGVSRFNLGVATTINA